MPSADVFTIIDKFKNLKKAYYPFLKKNFVRGTILNWAQPWLGHWMEIGALDENNSTGIAYTNREQVIRYT